MPQQINGKGTKDSTGLVFTSELIEQQRGSARGHGRSESGTMGLPSSFAALRPASLPPASNIRPEIRNNMNNETSTQSNNKAVPIQRRESEKSKVPILDALSFIPHQKELLMQLGAGTSIHRGSWEPNSKSWSIFDASRTEMEDGEDSGSELEDRDDKHGERDAASEFYSS